MVKKIIALLIATVVIVGFFGIDNKTHMISVEKAIKITNELKENTPYADEYDFYTYKITKINNSIIGVGLDSNKNIVLPKKYNSTNLQKGDIVTIVFAENKVVGVHKLVATKNGNYTMVDFIN